MPKAFIDRVIYIPLGKWLGVGAVLCFMENIDNIHIGRGEITGTKYNKAFDALNHFSKYFDKALSQGTEVLKEMNVDEEDAWKKGIFIYTGNEKKVSTSARILAFQSLQSKISMWNY
eukprot:5572993-Ditylum_brightwellii.AAC.1